MNLKYKTSIMALAGFLAVESYTNQAAAQIDEIVITARKREQSLQTVPIAVSAFSGDALIESGIGNTAELGQMVPNLTIFVTNVGLRATLRGQSINEGLITEDPSVNLNVDGIYIARPHASVMPFVDIAQVEVLRGPQGTLFGRNTTGGAINITTKLPEYDWGGEVGGRLANAQRGDVWGMLNAPIIQDQLAVRAALSLNNAGGFEDEKGVFNGESPFDDDSKSFFGSLLWEPTNNLDVVLRGDWSEKSSNYFESTHLVNIDTVGTGTGAARFGAVVNAESGGALTPADAFALYGFPNAQGELPLATFGQSSNHQNSSAAGLSLTATWEGELLNVKTVLSKRWLEQTSAFDLDGTPFRLLDTMQQVDHSQTSAELQFYGDFDLLNRNMDWIAGVFYFEEEALQGSSTDSLGALNPRSPQVNRGTGENDSIAGFAELDYELLEDFRITMGGRYTIDTKYASNTKSNGYFATEAAATALSGGRPVFTHPQAWLDLIPDTLTPLDTAGTSKDNIWTICNVTPSVLPDPTVCFVDNEDTFKAFSWNFGWDWTAWDDGANSALVYANYKRSFRSGGQNFRSTYPDNSFDPEYVRQIAAGAKLDLLDGNLRFNVEGFHQAITGKQVVSVIATATGGLGTLISNAASANVKGVEFEMNWTPLPDTLSGLQLNGSLGWTDPVYNSFPDAQPQDPGIGFNPVTNPLVAVSRANEPFVRVTELSANASIIYNHAILDSCDGNLLMRLDWSFKSDTPIEETAEFDINKPGSGPIGAMSSGDYFLVNARSALSLWDSAIELGVWCKNCTDTQYIQNALDLRDSLGYAVAEPSIPRTFGADLTYRWGVGR